MGIFQIKYIAEYTIGLNTKNKLNIMKRKKERKKEKRKKEKRKKEKRGKEKRRKEEEINKGELVYTSSPLYYNCTFKAKSI